MTSVRIHIGETTDGWKDRVADAFHRVADGAIPIAEFHLSFDSLETFTRVLTTRRVEMLRELHGRPASSIKALAERMSRDYHRVHEDVKVLADAGLIQRLEHSTELRTPYDQIEMETVIAL